jgi:hypothetical protein
VTAHQRNPLDPLVEVLIYAPIGLLYERDQVLPRLVTRGRSQVQLARVLGQLAVKQGQHAVEDRLGDLVGLAAGGLARALTDLGARVGLAPPPAGVGSPPPAEPPAEALAVAALPIAGYDRLPAREVIPLLAELTPEQRRVVRDHEMAHRGRKTVLHQLDRLGV